MTDSINRRLTPFSPPPAVRQEPKPAPSAAPPARKQTGHSTRNEFRSGTASAPVSLDPAASTLRTEQLGDGSANCLERATSLAGPGDQVVLLRDSRDGVGHAVVKHPDGSITDPNFPQHRYQSLGQWQAMNPAYHSPTAIPDGQLERVLRTPPGPQRNALISQLGLSGVADRRVADGTRTVSLEVTFEREPKDFKSGKLSGNITSGPYAGMSVELGWNPDRPNADGRFPVTVEVHVEEGVMRAREAKVGPFGVEGGAAAGIAGTRTYTLNLTADEMTRLQLNQFPLPSVVDPLSMPPGSTVMMSTEFFGTVSGGAAYGPGSLSEEMRFSQGYSFGVERLDGDRVRISTAPTTVMERTLALGLGFEVSKVEVSAELGRSREYGNAAFTSVELDLSTSEGMAAYEQFLSTHALPPDGPGVSNRAVSQTYTYEGALSAGIQVGPVDFGVALWNESASVVRTTQNGATTTTLTAEAALTGNQMSVSFRDENGKQVFDAMTFDVMLSDGRRASVTVTGQEGLESMRRVSWETASSNLLRFHGVDPSNPQAVEEFQKSRFEGTPQAALALQPGDPGFSYEAWTRAYDDLDLYRELPELPAVARAFIGNEGSYETLVGEPNPGDAYTDLMAAMDYALRTEDNDGAFLPTTLTHGTATTTVTNDWMDFGLENAPGVSVSFQKRW